MIYDDYIWNDFHSTWVSASEYEEMIELSNNWDNSSLNKFITTN
jgi:hypothetical protein